jgi:hypothetical protein
MMKKQERALEQIVTLRASVSEAQRRINRSVYKAVRVHGVPVRVVADRLGLTKQRVYQMVHDADSELDM